MNADTLPSPETNSEDLAERKLRDYFRSKLPAAFPPLSLPAIESSAEARRPRRGPLSRSRVVLAICLSLVLAVVGYLISQNPGVRSDRIRNLNEATGQNKALFKQSTPTADRSAR